MQRKMIRKNNRIRMVLERLKKQNAARENRDFLKQEKSDMQKNGLREEENLQDGGEKYALLKSINKAANQISDEAGEVKGQLWKALYQGKKKKFRKTMKRIRRSAPNEKVVDECREYLLNNWESAVRKLQDKNIYGCSAEGHVSHMYSDRGGAKQVQMRCAS